MFVRCTIYFTHAYVVEFKSEASTQAEPFLPSNYMLVDDCL